MSSTSEHDPVTAQHVHRRRAAVDSGRREIFGQLDPAVTVRGPHHRDGRPHTVQPDDAIDDVAFHRRLALQLQAQSAEERLRRLEVVDHHGDVVHTHARGHRAASEAFCRMSSSIAVGNVVSKSISFAQVGFTTIRTMPS